MRKSYRVFMFLLAFCLFSVAASAAPFNFIITPQRAEVALTIKPFEVFLSDNFSGTVNLDTGERSFNHDLYCGSRFYLATKGQLDTYLFGAIGLDQLEQESQEFKLGLGKQYNIDDTFAVFGEFGAKAVKTGQVLELTNTTNSLGMKFSF